MHVSSPLKSSRILKVHFKSLLNHAVFFILQSSFFYLSCTQICSLLLLTCLVLRSAIFFLLTCLVLKSATIRHVDLKYCRVSFFSAGCLLSLVVTQKFTVLTGNWSLYATFAQRVVSSFLMLLMPSSFPAMLF